MPELSRQTWIAAAGLLVLLVLPWLAEGIGQPFLTSLFSLILIYALAAVSLDLLIGYGGLASLGHGAFFGVGAYAVGILAFHHDRHTPLLSWPMPLSGTDQALFAWPLAVLVTAALAALIGAVCLRTRSMHFIMITLAFAQMLFFFFVSLEAYGGDDGLSLWSRSRLPGLDLGNDVHFYYVCLGLLVGFLYLCRRLVDSRFGMVIQGCRQNERRMGAFGFPTYRYRLACFVIAGAGAGLAGALVANQSEFVSPELLHWTRSGEILVMVLLGGAGTLFGPVLGAAALLLLEEVLAMYTEHWMAILGPLLVLAVLFAPRGLYGLLMGRSGRD
jgi:branched-chain amino acid transport system permease protein